MKKSADFKQVVGACVFDWVPCRSRARSLLIGRAVVLRGGNHCYSHCCLGVFPRFHDRREMRPCDWSCLCTGTLCGTFKETRFSRWP
jgi:hypothetical protein